MNIAYSISSKTIEYTQRDFDIMQYILYYTDVKYTTSTHSTQLRIFIFSHWKNEQIHITQKYWGK